VKVVSEVYAFRMGGGNRAGRQRRAVGGAERTSWAGQEAEAQWGEGERPVEKKQVGHGWAERSDGPAGRWADWAESEGKFISE
jgi:hypothetical protein